MLILFTVFFFIDSGNLHAQSEEIQWYTFSENYKTYIPVKEPGNKIRFFLNLEAENTSLLVKAPETSALFLENKLLSGLGPDKPFIANLDSLALIYRLDSVFITIYNAKSLKGLETYLINHDLNENSENQVVLRVRSANRDFYIFGFVFVLLIAAIVRLNASLQSVYLLSIRQLFLSQIVDNPFYTNSFFSVESVRFYVVISLALSLTGLYFSETLDYYLPMPDKQSFMSHFIYWIIYSIVTYFIFYVKFLLYKFLSGIYNFRRYTLIQNYDFMRISVIISAVYFLILFIDLFLININLILLLIIPLLAILIYLFVAYKKLNKIYSHTKLHLFSYLCVSEMVPLIFLIGILRN